MTRWRIDYETYSAADLRKVGGWAYAEHPTTEIILCAFQRVGSSRVHIWKHGEPAPLRLLRAFEGGDTFYAYNANFERAITEHVATRQWGLLYPPAVSQWRDTQAVAAMCAYPLALGACALALGLPEDKQKDKRGKQLINLFCAPRKPTKHNPSTRTMPIDAPGEFAEFARYCVQDVVTEAAVADALPLRWLGRDEQRVWEVDSQINRRGMRIDIELCKGAIAVEAKFAATQLKRLAKLTSNVIKTPKQNAVMLKWLAARGLSLPNLKSETIQAALLGEDVQGRVRGVLQIRANLARASTSKYKAMLACATPRDSRARGAHFYHAADTGRWAGRRFQVQNFARPANQRYDMRDAVAAGDLRALLAVTSDPLQILKDMLRHAIVAAPGKVLVVSDLSSIEARMLAYLAGEERVLKEFKSGRDLYKVMAAFIFGVKYEDVTDDQRFLGKCAILGLGYAMGEVKFGDSCLKMGRAVPRELLRKAVRTYRATYDRVPAFWSTMERAAIQCVVASKAGSNPRDYPAGPHIRFRMEGPHLTMRLPSGRRLWYPDASVSATTTKWGATRTSLRFKASLGKWWRWDSTYGGKLAQNATQAASRDLIAGALVQCEEERLPVVLHVHDEIGGEATRRRAAAALARLDSILRQVPAYLPGFPLDSKGFTSPYYKKG